MKTKNWFSIGLLFFTLSVAAQNQPGYYDVDSISAKSKKYALLLKQMDQLSKKFNDSLKIAQEEVSAFIYNFPTDKIMTDEQKNKAEDKINGMIMSIDTMQTRMRDAYYIKELQMETDFK